MATLESNHQVWIQMAAVACQFSLVPKMLPVINKGKNCQFLPKKATFYRSKLLVLYKQYFRHQAKLTSYSRRLCEYEVFTLKNKDLARLGKMGQICCQRKQLWKMSVQSEFQVSTFKTKDLAILGQMGQIWVKFVSKRCNIFKIWLIRYSKFALRSVWSKFEPIRPNGVAN